MDSLIVCLLVSVAVAVISLTAFLKYEKFGLLTMFSVLLSVGFFLIAGSHHKRVIETKIEYEEIFKTKHVVILVNDTLIVSSDKARHCNADDDNLEIRYVQKIDHFNTVDQKYYKVSLKTDKSVAY